MKTSGLFSIQEINSYCSDIVFSKHVFYINLIENLSPLFPSISSQDISQISNASYYILRSLLAFDTIVDDKEVSNLRLGLFNYQSALEKLGLLYSGNVAFWQSFKFH